MNLFIATLLVTFPLFFCAALLFNSCRKRTGKTGHCQQSSGGAGCSCSAAVQQIIQSADKIR